MGDGKTDGAQALAAALTPGVGSLSLAGLPGQQRAEQAVGSQTCHRMGCGEKFDPTENSDGSCRYHPNPPYFHDGMKEWTCCKKKSHDFGEFMTIPGCTTGRHSSEKAEKPVAAKPITPAVVPSAGPVTCLRCSQGFFCSDHAGAPRTASHASGAPPPPVQPAPIPEVKPPPVVAKPAPVPDADGYLVCRHFACGNKFKQAENHDKACHHHPGPAVFHDRQKGWGCCNKFERDFDAFLAIPPCTYAEHDASFEGTF
uniref:CHORD domain-containing protein n=1 Tax=Tetraselmis chuii TaxID=63592 RepID=A0A7S1STU7_9CHLO|mmetsp:Transcript_27922/g.49915  ORF Transcript_27922/g.49915 Transcript_27922/m.49915 type:complete len:256 (+) Transcript_27922:123-890(+)